MEYPRDFPREARDKVEAARIRAGRQFDSAKLESRSLTQTEVLFSDLVGTVFLAFAEEAGRLRLWALDEMDAKCREFLRVVSIDAYYSKGKAAGLSEITSHLDGSLRPEFRQRIEQTPNWRRYEDILLGLAEAANDPGVTNRRAAINEFIRKVTNEQRKITRKDIWITAGYRDATEFERFQRSDPRTTHSATEAFTRVLKMQPSEFIRVLERKTPTRK